MPIDPQDITYETTEDQLPAYWEASEAARIGEALIPKHHRHLVAFNILYLFKKKAGASKGKTVLGQAAKRSEKEQLITELAGETYHFVVTLGWDVWKELTEEQRKALVDHELCHCSVNEDGDPTIRAHDVEEFNEIIRRHGLWQADLQRTAKVVQQLDLFSGEPAKAVGGN